MVIRKFNESGTECFKEYLFEMKREERKDLPEDFLFSDQYTIPARGNIEIERKQFDQKKDLTLYIYELVMKLDEEKIFYSENLWNWLSAFFIDSVCPKYESGYRKVNAIVRHILQSEEWNRYYRHLLACPVRLYHELGEESEIILYGKAYEHGEHLEQLASHQQIASSSGIVEAAAQIYLTKNNKFKTGARGKKGPGIIRRFASDIIPQFQMTYDLNSMSGEEIVNLLPDEFDKWSKKTTSK